MILSAEQFTIRLPHPFRIAHGTSQTRDTILVHLRDEATGLIGHGEGALPPYYPSRSAACLAWLRVGATPPAPPEAAAASVALEIARHDLAAQQDGRPIWQSWGLDPTTIPPCARTISIPLNAEELRERLTDGVKRGSTHFKLKLGSGDLAWDQQCVELARAEFPHLHFSVDANAAWSPAEAAQLLPILARLGVDFVEQPVAREWGKWRELRTQISSAEIPPLVADESLQTEADLEPARTLADGVNIKLLKAGGLTAARHWVAAARAAGLRIMIGVMVETGIGRTAAAQLAPLADWLDLDPPDSIPMAPLTGITIEGDHLALSLDPGLGLRPTI